MLRVKNLTVVSKLARKIKKISDIPIRSFCTVGKKKRKKEKNRPSSGETEKERGRSGRRVGG